MLIIRFEAFNSDTLKLFEVMSSDLAKYTNLAIARFAYNNANKLAVIVQPFFDDDLKKNMDGRNQLPTGKMLRVAKVDFVPATKDKGLALVAKVKSARFSYYNMVGRKFNKIDVIRNWVNDRKFNILFNESKKRSRDKHGNRLSDEKIREIISWKIWQSQKKKKEVHSYIPDSYKMNLFNKQSYEDKIKYRSNIFKKSINASKTGVDIKRSKTNMLMYDYVLQESLGKAINALTQFLINNIYIKMRYARRHTQAFLEKRR